MERNANGGRAGELSSVCVGIRVHMRTCICTGLFVPACACSGDCVCEEGVGKLFRFTIFVD